MSGSLRALVGILLPVIAGCSAGGGAAVGPQDFRAQSDEPTDRVGVDRAIAQASRVQRDPLDASRFAQPDQSALVPPPVDPAEMVAAGPEIAPRPVSERPDLVLFDVKVGEVNNKPIFAAEFLDPLAQRLEALAYKDVRLPGGETRLERVPRDQWRAAAVEVINQQLIDFINNELVIAEGLASFTPGQRAGLRNFLGFARGKLEQEAGGSITRAVRNLGTGQTLSEYLQEVRNRQLIGKFAEDLRRSVVVTRSDVERLYLQRYGDNRRDSTMTFREIRVPKEDAEGAARVADRLSRGEPFAEVATDEASTSSFRSSGGLWPAMAFNGTFEEATFFPRDPLLDEALRGLTPGEWAGPIEGERYVSWLYLDSIQIGYKTWAEAQSELRNELYETRLDQAYQRAMTRLYEQAGLGDLGGVRDELLMVAEDWFYPKG
jgi:hypothetical protein